MCFDPGSGLKNFCFSFDATQFAKRSLSRRGEATMCSQRGLSGGAMTLPTNSACTPRAIRFLAFPELTFRHLSPVLFRHHYDRDRRLYSLFLDGREWTFFSSPRSYVDGIVKPSNCI
jgi:hypothetical protein